MSKESRHDPDAVMGWIEDLEDGVISPVNRARLMDLLRNDRAALELYLSHTQLSALLQQSAESRSELGTLPVSLETLRREKRRSALLSLGYAAAALVVLGLGLLLHQVSLPDAPGSWVAIDGSNDAAFAVVHGSEDRDADSRVAPGDQITLQRGLLRLRFASGVEALVEGPSQMELISESTLRLDGGIGWFRVPENARGFTVRTELGRVVDLGTEFGIRFARGGDLEVHVNQGLVKVLPSAPGTGEAELAGGEAMAFDVSGTSRPVDLQPGLFRRQFSKSIPHVHWSFDTLIGDTFPASGTFPGVEDFALRVRRLDGGRIAAEELHSGGKFARALSLGGDGAFAESSFPGIDGDAPRTVAAWIRHRARSLPHGADPRTGQGALPPSGDQAYLLNYTNAGLSTTRGATGISIEAGTTYALQFQTAALPGQAPAEYLVELVAFGPSDDDAARMDVRAESSPGMVVATASGLVETPGQPARDQVTFTARPDDPSLGRELGIRIVKASGPMLYDDIRLSARRDGNPEVLEFSEDFESPVVTGYAEQVLPSHGWTGGRTGPSSTAPGFGSSRHGLFSRRPVSATPFVSWKSPSPGTIWSGFILPTSPPVWTITDAHGCHDAPETSPIAADRWTHVATVYTGRMNEDGRPEILHFINGKATQVKARPFKLPTPSSGATDCLLVGAAPGASPGDPTLDADIDELHILRAALSTEEIRQLMEENRTDLGKD